MTTTFTGPPDTRADDHRGPDTPSPVTGTMLRRQTAAALRLLLVLTVLLGIVYPLAIWAVSHVPGLDDHAEGSLLGPDGAPTGSSLIGVDPTPTNPGADPWFHTRPSASAPEEATAGLGPADPTTSGGSNLSADSDTLRDAVDQRRQAIAAREGVAPDAVPPDAVTASGSGLDPAISPAYAALQVPRVARVSGLGEDRVRALVADATGARPLGFLGEPAVDVPELDAALRAAAPGIR